MTARMSPALVLEQYKALFEGVDATDGRPKYYYLVASSSFDEGRGDLFVAAGLARAMAASGNGVELVGPAGWYVERPAGSIVVAMIADTDVRRIPGDVVVVAWIRNRTAEWLETPGFGLYDGVVASSELSRREVARVYDGPTGVCRIGFDPELFYPGDELRDVQATTTANHWGTDRGVHVAIRELAARGVDVAWYGVDRSKDADLGRINLGTLNFADVPALYRRSIVTIDDLLDVSIGFGNLNSRIFEALACGSLVVTNGGLGLREAGLEDVPVYRTPEELAEIVAAASSGAFDRVVKDLSERVRKEHSFAARAGVFEEFADAARAEHERRRTVPVLHFFPDYSSTNPYQTLLYSDAVSSGLVAPVSDIFNVPIARDPGGDLSGHTLHLHWLNGIVQPGKNIFEANYRLNRFKQAILNIKERGARIVWTAHNVMPHEFTHYFVERELNEFVADVADVVHVMSRDTVAVTADYYEISEEKAVLVEHPSFDNAYPQMLDRPTARLRLGMNDDDRSFLFFGAIRPYKGLPTLLSAYELASARDARLRLDVAGGLARTAGNTIVERMRSMERVTAHLGFVDEADVQKFLLAADVLVLPYDNILNSGSVMLAATFGLPVVVPRLGQLRELEGEPWVEFFEAGSHESLAEALERGGEFLSTPAARGAAQQFAEERAPGLLAGRFTREVLGWHAPAVSR